MTAISQVFMRYKVSESYWVFNGEYHEYIDNVQNEEKKTTENQIYLTKSSRRIEFFYLNCLQQENIRYSKKLKA